MRPLLQDGLLIDRHMRKIGTAKKKDDDDDRHDCVNCLFYTLLHHTPLAKHVV